MAWVAPKIDWTPKPGVANADLNRIEGDILYLKEQHVDLSTGVHGAVSAATASKIVIRDAAGRAKVAPPSAADDLALKQTVDDEGTARAAADGALQTQITGITTAYLPLAGGTMVGAAVGHVGVDYTTARFRNVTLSTVAPTAGQGNNGDVWCEYDV